MKQKKVLHRFGSLYLFVTYDDAFSGLERLGILFVSFLISAILFVIVANTLNAPVAFFVAGFLARSIQIRSD